MNVYFAEENTPDMSTDKLHSKINEFFKLEGQFVPAVIANKLKKKKLINAEGWEEFRLDKISVRRFTKKGKKKKIGGARSSRHNYRSLKTDINAFHYDDVINKQLYHTRRGQEIWLELGFSYQRDEL